MPTAESDDYRVTKALATYELLNDEVSERLAELRSSAERVETKATFLAGFAVTASTVLLESGSLDAPRKAALVLFSVAFVGAFVAFAVGRWEQPPDPEQAVAMYQDASRIEALAGIVGTKAAAYPRNKKRQEFKANAWFFAAGTLGVGSFVLLVAALT